MNALRRHPDHPIAAADFDRDGRWEIAAAITPHFGGTLKVCRRQGSELIEIAVLSAGLKQVYGLAKL